jgi:hypothetical protein
VSPITTSQLRWDVVKNSAQFLVKITNLLYENEFTFLTFQISVDSVGAAEGFLNVIFFDSEFIFLNTF